MKLKNIALLFIEQVYIQARWKWRGTWLVKPAVQAAFVAFAVWNSYTRVAIYHHDIYEVNRGIALGVSFAVIMVREIEVISVR